MSDKAFVDTNVLLYLVAEDDAKAAIAETILKKRPTISVQVLNELASVATRKFGMSLDEVLEFEQAITAHCTVESLSIDHHDLALSIAKRHGFSIYDSLIVASALIAGCSRLYSEDLHHDMQLLRQLRIVNPFVR